MGTWFNLAGANSSSSIQRLNSKSSGGTLGGAILTLIVDNGADPGFITTRVVMNTNNGGTEQTCDDNPGLSGNGIISTAA